MSKPVRTGHCSRHKVAAVDGGCVYCDDENPIMERTFIGAIKISHDDLTQGGNVHEVIGWEYVMDEIYRALKSINAEFIDWEGEPQ